MDTETVIFHHLSLASRVTKKDEWSEEKNGHLEVHLVLRNESNDLLSLEAATYFKDTRGNNLLDGEGAWVPIFISPHEEYHYSALCKQPGATGYQTHFRLAEM